MVFVSGCYYKNVGTEPEPYVQKVDKNPNQLGEQTENGDSNLNVDTNVEDVFADTDVEPPMMPN